MAEYTDTQMLDWLQTKKRKDYEFYAILLGEVWQVRSRRHSDGMSSVDIREAITKKMNQEKMHTQDVAKQMV